MARKQKLDQKKFYGLNHEYDVVFMIDPEDGKVHTGVRGRHISANTRAEAALAVQDVIDQEENIGYIHYRVIDMSAEHPQMGFHDFFIAGNIADDRGRRGRQKYLMKDAPRQVAYWRPLYPYWTVIPAGSASAGHAERLLRQVHQASGTIDDAVRELETLDLRSP